MSVVSVLLCLCGLDVCPKPIPESWIEYPNTHVHRGIANSDPDLVSCQSSCTRNSSCTRLDWSVGASAGSRCWLHGDQSSSESRRAATGVTHYELKRSAVASWVKYADMHAPGGIATGSTDLAGCQQFCVNNASCMRIDWASWASAGRRCWIHGPWSSSEQRRSLQNVEHFELFRGSDDFCGEYSS